MQRFPRNLSFLNHFPLLRRNAILFLSFKIPRWSQGTTVNTVSWVWLKYSLNCRSSALKILIREKSHVHRITPKMTFEEASIIVKLRTSHTCTTYLRGLKFRPFLNFGSSHLQDICILFFSVGHNIYVTFKSVCKILNSTLPRNIYITCEDCLREHLQYVYE